MKKGLCKLRFSVFLLLLMFIFCNLPIFASGEETIDFGAYQPKVKAQDNPDDNGRKLMVEWEKYPNTGNSFFEGYKLFRIHNEEETFIGDFDTATTSLLDEKGINRGEMYKYKLIAKMKDFKSSPLSSYIYSIINKPAVASENHKYIKKFENTLFENAMIAENIIAPPAGFAAIPQYEKFPVVILHWQQVDYSNLDTFTGYTISRKIITEEGLEYEKIALIRDNVFIDENVEIGQAYSYKIECTFGPAFGSDAKILSAEQVSHLENITEEEIIEETEQIESLYPISPSFFSAEAQYHPADTLFEGIMGIKLEWDQAGNIPDEYFAGYKIKRTNLKTGKTADLGFIKDTQYFDESFVDEDFIADAKLKGNYLPKSNYLYKYEICAVNSNSIESISEEVIPVGQLFDSKRINILIPVLLFSGMLLFFIFKARKNGKIFIRPIAGINAIDEAIGRATEMGKPMLYITGLGSIAEIATIASITILQRVAEKAAEYESPLIVPCYDPIVMTIAQEVIKEAHSNVGKPDNYREDNIFFLTQSQFSYVAGVNGIMMREKTATNFYMGSFFAESLLLAETGSQTGSIQISGTDQVTQIPFFITSCDYTLIGEELYAASAYLSREPLLLGSLKAQDYGKAIVVFLMFAGSLILTFGGDWVSHLFEIN